jgi:hypothetical protein
VPSRTCADELRGEVGSRLRLVKQIRSRMTRYGTELSSEKYLILRNIAFQQEQTHIWSRVTTQEGAVGTTERSCSPLRDRRNKAYGQNE